MKRKIILVLLLLVVCVGTSGCRLMKKTKNEMSPIVADWGPMITSETLELPQDAQDAFNRAMLNETRDIIPIALLGTQVVAGTNYMFLTLQNHMAYGVIVVYNDLQNNSSITKETIFNVKKYANKNIPFEATEMVGGWTTTIPEVGGEIEEDILNDLKRATASIDTKYTPIKVIATQMVSGYNYAIMCYGNDGGHEGVYVVTIYENLNHDAELLSEAYVNLADFNQ